LFCFGVGFGLLLNLASPLSAQLLDASGELTFSNVRPQDQGSQNRPGGGDTFADLYVEDIVRVDGGPDLVGNGLAIFSSEADYIGGADPIIEIRANGTLQVPPQGDVSMGAFGAR